jgi:hypothetical protein
MPSLITYTLNEHGQIPDYILDGGYYPKDNLLIGISNSDEEGFTTKANLIEYLQSYTQDWKESKSFPKDDSVIFDVENAANYLWDKFNAFFQ